MVMLEATNIAPRCEARPREVIFNPNALGAPSQRRGEPLLLGWAWWVLGLSYDQLLKGVEGTGTREGGLKVSALRVFISAMLAVLPVSHGCLSSLLFSMNRERCSQSIWTISFC
jgi:hypothetical protein